MELQVGQFQSETTKSWPLIHVQNAVLLNILRMNRQISITFCICIDIYIYDHVLPSEL